MHKVFFYMFTGFLGLTACSGPMRMQGEPIVESLFNEKDKTISEADIQRLLDGSFALPDSLRVAVYKLGTNSPYAGWYNRRAEYTVNAHQMYIDTLTQGILRDSKVKRVNIIPSLLLSNQPSITQLREASVRLQSDILVVFAPVSSVFYKTKTLKKDEVKAYATTEILIVDIRTALIPFSTIVSREVVVRKQSGETMDETKERAQREAVLRTLTEGSKQILGYLSTR
jgi:hypothetical protein